jgi:hypothetical protein
MSKQCLPNPRLRGIHTAAKHFGNPRNLRLAEDIAKPSVVGTRKSDGQPTQSRPDRIQPAPVMVSVDLEEVRIISNV